jgi:hypothetical protein
MSAELVGSCRGGPPWPPKRLISNPKPDPFCIEWRRKGYVSENYSSIIGTGDDVSKGG